MLCQPLPHFAARIGANQSIWGIVGAKRHPFGALDIHPGIASERLIFEPRIDSFTFLKIASTLSQLRIELRLPGVNPYHRALCVVATALARQKQTKTYGEGNQYHAFSARTIM
jgi:hypothetical protein